MNVTDRQDAYVREVVDALRAAGIRAEAGFAERENNV